MLSNLTIKHLLITNGQKVCTYCVISKTEYTNVWIWKWRKYTL